MIYLTYTKFRAFGTIWIIMIDVCTCTNRPITKEKHVFKFKFRLASGFKNLFFKTPKFCEMMLWLR